jgi:predicted dehydrogenase
MTEQRFRVGIVGLEPGRGWAARAHVPALRALSDSTRPARGVRAPRRSRASRYRFD